MASSVPSGNEGLIHCSIVKLIMKILTIKEAFKIANKIRRQHKSIVLVGGCFDILHTGHIEFLTQAKKQGNVLMVLLESDETIQHVKGGERPINNQSDRSIVLTALSIVNYVILLDHFTKDQEYDDLVKSIKPDIIATTTGDPYRIHKERQAKLVGSRVVDVVHRISHTSTSKLAELLSKENL